MLHYVWNIPKHFTKKQSPIQTIRTEFNLSDASLLFLGLRRDNTVKVIWRLSSLTCADVL
jgi:hypothetical protein